MVTNINFLLTISIQCQEIRLWELIKWWPKRKCFDLLSNCLNSFFKEMYRDQFGEFACGYWGLKGQKFSLQVTHWKGDVKKLTWAPSTLNFSSWSSASASDMVVLSNALDSSSTFSSDYINKNKSNKLYKQIKPHSWSHRRYTKVCTKMLVEDQTVDGWLFQGFNAVWRKS